MWPCGESNSVDIDPELTADLQRRGVARSSMTSQLLESNTKENGEIEDEDVIAGSVGVAYVGTVNPFANYSRAHCHETRGL